MAAPAPAFAGSPVVVPVSDRDGDKIADSLKLRMTKGKARLVEINGQQQLSLLVALSVAPAAEHRQRVEACGGSVVRTWNELVYAQEIVLPQAALNAYVSSEPDLVEVTENAEMRGALMITSRQIGAREVWTGSPGFTGNPSHSIAILDTGVDDSHTDLPTAVLYSDQVGDSVPTGWDGAGHGTHVAGVALGRGAAAGLEDYSISLQQHFPTTTGSGFLTLFPVRATSGSRNISTTVSWGSSGNGLLQIQDDNGTALINNSGSSPVSVSQSISGVTDKNYKVLPAASSTPPGGDVYTLQINSAYESLGDGQPLVHGMAPSCGLVAVRVLPDSGNGNLSVYVNGLTLLSSVRKTHQIVVANASLTSDSTSDVVDTATNNAVDNGIVLVIAVGNSQQISPEQFAGSPGTASKALTVGAINRSDSVSNFSTRGSVTAPVVKPDVVAPGGSALVGESIVSVDSNDKDSIIDRNFSPPTETLDDDAFADDYSLKLGTSIASPHVAGIAALLADALQRPWNFDSGADSLLVKSLICLTASEVQSGEDETPGPAGRAATPKDNVEGYGRVNARAAVDALTRTLDMNTTHTGTLAGGFGEERVWARRAFLFGGYPYNFTLSVPSGTDFDLHLYNPDPTSNGEPVTSASSTTAAAGGDEAISDFVPTSTGYYFLVVKRISGDGTFQIFGTGKTAAQGQWVHYE